MGRVEGYLPRLRAAAPSPAILALDAFEVKLRVQQVPGRRAPDTHIVTGAQCVFLDPVTFELRRAPPFRGVNPRSADTTAFLALDEDPGVGIAILALHDGSGDLDHVVFEIGGTEGMMGSKLHGHAEHAADYTDGEESLRHVIFLLRGLLATAAP